jgi:hypothetical protein
MVRSSDQGAMDDAWTDRKIQHIQTHEYCPNNYCLYII